MGEGHCGSGKILWLHQVRRMHHVRHISRDSVLDKSSVLTSILVIIVALTTAIAIMVSGGDSSRSAQVFGGISGR